MNDIIKKIEDAQLKQKHRSSALVIPLKFTVKSKRVTASVSRYSRRCPEKTGRRKQRDLHCS